MKRIIGIFLSFILLTISISTMAIDTENNSYDCYIASTECPTAYIEYATENISKFILSMGENINYNSISIGTPFAFADNNADVYYFPVICDGNIEYLFRVYPDGNSFSAAITAFLANEIENLSEYTSESNPMYLNLIDTQIVATIGSNSYILFEYPTEMAVSNNGINMASVNECSVVNIKNPTEINLDLRQTRDVSKYIHLDLTETQGGESWCTAYCLAAIIRTQTNFTTTANDLMRLVVNRNPRIDDVFPWGSDNGSTMMSISAQYGLYPTVLTTTASNATLIAEINAGRPCIMAMYSGSSRHAVVLRGFSSYGTWGIWNPWYDYYESYSTSGAYVPTGYTAEDYSYRPYMHAYNFG